MAHIVPFSLLNQPQRVLYLFKTLFPWLPDTFLTNLDTAENMVTLSSTCHDDFDEFCWYIEYAKDGKYYAREFGERNLHVNGSKRQEVDESGEIRFVDLFNTPLDLKGVSNKSGKAIATPSAAYLKLHELVCRITYLYKGCSIEDFLLKGSSEEFTDFSDEDDEQIDYFRSDENEMDVQEKVKIYFESQKDLEQPGHGQNLVASPSEEGDLIKIQPSVLLQDLSSKTMHIDEL